MNLRKLLLIIQKENHLITNKTIEVLNNYDIYYKKLGLDTLDLNQLKC